MTPAPRFSLVVPLYNEAANIEPVIGPAIELLRGLVRDFEAILVDDGSTDQTPAKIAQLAAHFPEVRSLRHDTNRGQAAALLTGLHAARGDIILTMDGDGQNDPRDFPLVITPVEAGAFDVMCGWRVDRHDSWPRRIMSRIGNVVRRRLLGDHLHDAGCQLRAFRRDVISVLFPVDLMQSFLPSIAVAAGFRVGEIPVRHHPRVRERAHFGVRQLWWRPFVAMLAVRRRLRK